MKILLDTHILLWFQSMDKRLSTELRDFIEYSDHDLYISQVSFWEIAIKVSIGKLMLDQDLDSTFRSVKKAGFLGLSFTNEHFIEVSGLPMHHRDPFDRMLIAQAKVEEMQLLTSDPHFALYDVTLVSV